MNDISKKLSCGVIVVVNGKVLIQHVTNQSHWDIPKGTQQPGETTSQTAVRELFEETGLKVEESQLINLGWYEYNRYKDLYLYLVNLPGLDLSTLKCSSSFTDEDGSTQIEADDYKLVTASLMGDYVCKSMSILLDNELLKDIRRDS